jgi:mannose-6-phosphate isomerase-like protein (cupin superfamily)
MPGSEIVRFPEKFGKVAEHWSPKIVAQMNDLHVKIAKIEGEFVWHSHADTDELFWVHKGRFDMHYRDRVVTLTEGDLHIVPKGVEHRPVAAEECEIIMIEPAGTVNTGDAGGNLTVEEPPWI